MQTFIDTATQQVWAFDDDVDTSGGVFKTEHGTVLTVPATLQAYTVPVPTAAQLLAQAKTAQIATLVSELTIIDQKSIRDIRAFLVAKFSNDPLMPPTLTADETEAQSKRHEID